MKNLLLLLLCVVSLKAASQHTDSRVFEMRVYNAEEGKLDALVERFQKHTIKIFKKHHMENIGYWLPIHNEKNQLVYILGYPSMEAREAAWKAFGEDPKWKKVKAKSEINGKLVKSVESTFMKATDFSPAITASKKGNRVFELRTYTITPGKTDDLMARFRNHTMALFAKHGAVNMPYWLTIEKDAVTQPKLIYFLAHADEATGKQTLTDFVNDPEWIKVRDASERNGSLVVKVESVYMKALPFSKIK